MTKKVLLLELVRRLDIPEKDVMGYWIKYKKTEDTWQYKTPEELSNYKTVCYQQHDAYLNEIYYVVPSTDAEGAWKLLPTKIDNYELTITFGQVVVFIEYDICLSSHHEVITSDDGKDASFSGNTLIEAISSMLEWLLDNEYIGEKK